MCSLREPKSSSRAPLDIAGYLVPRVTEQLRVLLPITLYLVFFQLVILRTEIQHPLSIASAMLAVSHGQWHHPCRLLPPLPPRLPCPVGSRGVRCAGPELQRSCRGV